MKDDDYQRLETITESITLLQHRLHVLFHKSRVEIRSIDDRSSRSSRGSRSYRSYILDSYT